MMQMAAVDQKNTKKRPRTDDGQLEVTKIASLEDDDKIEQILVPVPKKIVVQADAPKIGIFRTGNALRVWNANEANLMRNEYQIYGSLIGSLPSQPQQNVSYGLPVILSPEEAVVLLELGAAILYDDTESYRCPSNEEIAQLKRPTEAESNNASRHLTGDRHAHSIKDQQPIIISTNSSNLPHFTPKPLSRHDLAFPQTEQDRVRLFIFRDLWERGYYMTSGAKFGGEYLVYAGDLNRYHAHYVALIQLHSLPLTPLQLVSFGRLATTVKKTFLICSQTAEGKAQYVSIEWTGMN